MLQRAGAAVASCLSEQLSSWAGAYHPRLGQRSVASALSADLLGMVAAEVLAERRRWRSSADLEEPPCPVLHAAETLLRRPIGCGRLLARTSVMLRWRGRAGARAGGLQAVPRGPPTANEIIGMLTV